MRASAALGVAAVLAGALLTPACGSDAVTTPPAESSAPASADTVTSGTRPPPAPPTTAEPKESSTVTSATQSSVAPTTTESPADPTTTARAPDAATNSAVVDGIEISATTVAGATAGTRVPMSIVVRNVGDEEVLWQAGGCGYPASASVGPAGADHARGTEPGWDGEMRSLARWVAVANTLSPVQGAQPADATGRREIGCTADSDLEPLPPGASLTLDASAEVRVPPGDLPQGGNYVVRAEFVSYLAPDDHPNGARQATVEVPLTIVDDPARVAGSDAAALAAIAADPRLAEWFERAAVTGNPQLKQVYSIELGWWRGAWELRVSPKWSGNETLRVRYDPAAGRIVDARSVMHGAPPSDEPGAVPFPGSPPDEILIAADDPPPSTPVTPSTIASSGAVEVDVVLAGDLPPVEPQVVQVLEVTRPDEDRPAPVAIASTDFGIVGVVDLGAGTLRLVAAPFGEVFAERPLEPAALASPSFTFGGLLGPDEVLYLFEAEQSSNRVAAYGSVDGTYRLVAASEWWESPADGQPTIVLGPRGPAYATSMTEPILEYVDRTGAPSGVTLPVEPLVAGFSTSGSQTHDIARGNASWRIAMSVTVSDGRVGLAGICPACVVTVGGPHDVLIVDSRGTSNDPDTIVAVLAPDGVSVRRVLWNYVGATGDFLLFSRFTDGGVELGMVLL